MEVYINIGFLLVSLVSGLTVYLQGRTPLYLRLFPVFLFVSGIVQLIAISLAYSQKSNIAIYNFNSVFEFSFFLFVLREIIVNKNAKKTALIIMWIYPVFASFNIIFIQKINNWNSVSYSLGSLFVVALSVYYFFELFKLPNSMNLAKEPPFWLCSGLLFFYCCSFPFFGLINFMRNMPLVILQNLGSILTFLNILLHLSFTIAFLCRIRIRQPVLWFYDYFLMH